MDRSSRPMRNGERDGSLVSTSPRATSGTDRSSRQAWVSRRRREAGRIARPDCPALVTPPPSEMDRSSRCRVEHPRWIARLGSTAANRSARGTDRSSRLRQLRSEMDRSSRHVPIGSETDRSSRPRRQCCKRTRRVEPGETDRSSRLLQIPFAGWIARLDSRRFGRLVERGIARPDIVVEAGWVGRQACPGGHSEWSPAAWSFTIISPTFARRAARTRRMATTRSTSSTAESPGSASSVARI